MNLNQVTLAVNDIEEAVTFYKTLGLIQIVADDHYALTVMLHFQSISTQIKRAYPPEALCILSTKNSISGWMNSSQKTFSLTMTR